MSAPLNIRDPRARELARELASRRKTSITAAVIEALEHELVREREAIPLATGSRGLPNARRLRPGLTRVGQ